MATKHEQILRYIEDLPIDSKISVRSIAKDLKVSDGTAYRAIKEAENRQLVKTVERVGTVRIEPVANRKLSHLTIEEVSRLTDCRIYGGAQGLNKKVQKFIIGAMEADDVRQYLAVDSLLIVGNREEIQRIALDQGVAVLITGGFKPSKEIIDLANERQITVMTASFDTYATATIINKALIERSIQREILVVEDIYIPFDKTSYIYDDHKIVDYRRLNLETGHTRFPVVNHNHQLLGMVTAKDLLDHDQATKIAKVMTPAPVVAKTQMSVASVTQRMLVDGLEILPVVDDQNQLLGILSRQDVLQTLQYSQFNNENEGQIEHLLDENLKQVSSSQVSKTHRYRFTTNVTMTDQFGVFSSGILSATAQRVLHKYMSETYNKLVVVKTVSLYFLQALGSQNTIDFVIEELELTRRSLTAEVKVWHGQELLAKAIMTANIFEN
ncbi:thioesterase [Aerococcus urinaehominis]|uniref:Thioesterase n=1 Tax=Aerococcus urinaehominis TaxID=128944 RepID=A0A109RGS2_9LACT|nr:DRTGG domain-containing protein [Aerococcus urinaehominis]AMB98931.1 thioesterase [Aerococcus urinaehominis]SDM40135.1 Predicted transcriptional regulator containing CBS domains [Aerococcus urinaehominis]